MVHHSSSTARQFQSAALLVLASLTACGGPRGKMVALQATDTGDPLGSAADPGDTDDGALNPGDDTPPTETDTGGSDTVLEDDAQITASHLPTDMACGEVTSVAIAVRNTGSATWTRDAGYKLGTVDDDDPFYDRDTRVWLSDSDVVAGGEVWTFEFELAAPATAGLYTTDWQMVHENVQWFGETTVHEINVSCAGDSTPAGPPNLDEVVWLHSDVSDWSETSVLSSVYVSGDQICLDYDKADVWPIYDSDGTEVVGNPWIFIWEDETWYAGTWEWLRPGQTCKAIDSVAGSHIKVAPFEEDSGWQPTSGQTYWFMVSGLARWSERTVEERTNLVSFVWP